MPVRKRNGKWHYRFWVDGREYSAATDLDDTLRNKTAAMRAEAAARTLVLSGKESELKIQAMPFLDAAQHFLDWADGEHSSHPNTARRLRTSFASLRAFFRTTPVSAVLRGHVNDYKAWRRSEHGVRDVTLRHDLHALSKAYRYFIDHNWARVNPVSGVDIPSDKDAVRIHVLDEEEERRYFAAALSHTALYDLGRIIIKQGLRPDEVLNLTAADCDFERDVFVVQQGKSRAAKRKLRMAAEVREILARRCAAGTRYLFEGLLPGSRLTKLNNAHNRVLSATGLNFVLYDFRHTFATRAAEAGMPVATLAAILGHGDLRSVTKYVHVREREIFSALEALESGSLSGSVRFRSGPGPVDPPKKRDSGGSSGIH